MLEKIFEKLIHNNHKIDDAMAKIDDLIALVTAQGAKIDQLKADLDAKLAVSTGASDAQVQDAIDKIAANDAKLDAIEVEVKPA